MFRLALALALVAGCSMSLPPATAMDASRANIALADLESGRSLVLSKCSSCHRPPMPARHGARDWPGKIDEMSQRAKLDTTQRRLIEDYLVTMAVR
jgi:hypothetical protein